MSDDPKISQTHPLCAQLSPIETTLYQIADECGISIIRWDSEPLAEFADRLIEEIAEKIREADGFIDEIRQLDLNHLAEVDAP